MSGLPSSTSGSGTQISFAGRQVWPTVQWAAAVLRQSPLLVAISIVASGLELFAAEGDPVRSLVSLVGMLFVTALAAIVAEDADAEEGRSLAEQIRVAVAALPRLALVFLGFFVVLFFGVFLPIFFVRVLGMIIAIVVIVYLVTMFNIVLPAVIVDSSISAGRAVFANNRLLAFGLLVVIAVGRLPTQIVSPTPADPILATVLVVWAGVLSALSGLAYAKVYLVNRS